MDVWSWLRSSVSIESFSLIFWVKYLKISDVISNWFKPTIKIVNFNSFLPVTNVVIII